MQVLGNYDEVEFPEEMKEHARRGMKKVIDWLRSQPDLRSKMSGIYHWIDSINEESFKGKEQPSCKKGCAHCCYIQVACTEWEIDLILDYMDHIGVEFDEKDIETLKHQAALKGTKEYIESPYRRCVFLQDDNTCGIYEVRPAACRNYFVFNDPSECDTFNPNASGMTKVNFNVDSVIPILAITQESEMNTMPQHFVNKLNL